MRLAAVHRRWTLPVLLLLFLPAAPSCLLRFQKFEHFRTETPIPAGDVLIVGILGGRDRWDHPNRGVTRLARELRSMNLDGVHVETAENARRGLVVRLVAEAFDRGRFRTTPDAPNDQEPRVILYGQSLGGAAVLDVARRLDELGIPVLLTVQVDSVGLEDDRVPPNVSYAANLYQADGLILQGRHEIRADDPQATQILGNWRFGYGDREIDLEGASWWQRFFGTAHAQMDFDPEVWKKVKEIIFEVLQKEGTLPKKGS